MPLSFPSLWPAFLVFFGDFSSVRLLNIGVPWGPLHPSLHNTFWILAPTPDAPRLSGHDSPAYICTQISYLAADINFLNFFPSISTWMLQKHVNLKCPKRNPHFSLFSSLPLHTYLLSIITLLPTFKLCCSFAWNNHFHLSLCLINSFLSFKYQFIPQRDSLWPPR